MGALGKCRTSRTCRLGFWLSIRRWNIGFCFGLFRMFLFFRLCKVLINSPPLCSPSIQLFSTRSIGRTTIIIVSVAHQLVNAINQTALHFILAPFRYSQTNSRGIPKSKQKQNSNLILLMNEWQWQRKVSDSITNASNYRLPLNLTCEWAANFLIAGII